MKLFTKMQVYTGLHTQITIPQAMIQEKYQTKNITHNVHAYTDRA